MTTPVLFAAALFTAGVVSAVTAIVVLGRVRAYTHAIPLTFAAATLAAAVWATAYGFSILSVTPSERLLWTQLTWLGVAAVGTLWFMFVLSYAGYDDLLTTTTTAVLSVEPAAVVAVALTGQRHGLFLDGVDAFSGGLPTVSAVSPPFLVFHTVYTTALVAVGVVVLARQVSRSRRLHRRQAGVVLAASALPMFTVVASFGGISLIAPIDATPLTFGLSSGMVLVGFYRYQLFDVPPMARDVVVGELRDGVVIVDHARRIVETNPRFRSLVGVDSGALLGQSLVAVPQYGATLRRLVDEESAREELTVDVDGERRYFEATASLFEGSEAHERGHLIILRDVTERLRSESEFRALIENSRDLLAVLAVDGTHVYCSPSFERLLGYEPNALVTENVFSFVHPEDRPEVEAAFESLCSQPTDAQNRVEYRFRHADGSWRTLSAVWVNSVDDSTTRGVVMNARDVTGRRRYEQRLKVLNRVLRHDLRNEVNVIQGHADLLADQNLTVEAKEHATVISRKADTLVELGEQTRKIDYTLHSTDGVEKPLEICALLHDRLDDIQCEFPAAIISRDFPDEQWVLADDLIDSALMNLVDNAIEHNDRVAPQIDVSMETLTVDGIDFVEVSIADNGPGIPAAEQRVFAEGTETPLSHGSGLGLWLTEWIVTRSNGHLDFVPNDPRGTVVSVRLRETAPDAETPSAGRTAHDRTQAQAPSSTTND